MKILMIGGTGTISMAITRQLAAMGEDLTLLNRGNRSANLPEDVKTITADISNEEATAKLLEGMTFDVVCEFIGFVPAQVERDIRLFAGKTKQYMYISSASAYQKPLSDYKITESTPLSNPYWEYSRNKIACEDVLMRAYRESGFPVTIIRPSHTYDERNLPLGADSPRGSWPVVKRMLEGKPVILHGDGATLWTVTHNTDFAKGFIGLMGNKHAIGDCFHITTDESLTWNQIYQIVADALGVAYKPYYVPTDFLADVAYFDLGSGLTGDKSNTVVFDNSKLKRAVPDFCATTRFDQGARSTVAYMLSHPECQREDPDYDAWCDRVIAAMEKARAEVKAYK